MKSGPALPRRQTKRARRDPGFGAGPRRLGPTDPAREGTRDGASSDELQGLWGARPRLRTTMGGASRRPPSLVCEAHHARCVLDLLAPRRPETAGAYIRAHAKSGA